MCEGCCDLLIWLLGEIICTFITKVHGHVIGKVIVVIKVVVLWVAVYVWRLLGAVLLSGLLTG